MKYVPSRVATEILGLSPNTLRKYADQGLIKVIRNAAGQRRYDVESYIGEQTKAETVCYCRVYSRKQKDALARQVAFMREQFPSATIVKDVGSGLNFKRKGLRALLERAVRGDKLTIVVAHRDRLARGGFVLIAWIIEQSGGEIMVLDRDQDSPEAEVTKDLLEILHDFSRRVPGLQRYHSQIEQDPDLPG